MSSKPVSDSHHLSSEGPSYGPSLKSSPLSVSFSISLSSQISSRIHLLVLVVLSAPPQHILSSSVWEHRKSFAFSRTNLSNATGAKLCCGPARHYDWNRNLAISGRLQR